MVENFRCISLSLGVLKRQICFAFFLRWVPTFLRPFWKWNPNPVFPGGPQIPTVSPHPFSQGWAGWLRGPNTQKSFVVLFPFSWLISAFSISLVDLSLNSPDFPALFSPISGHRITEPRAETFYIHVQGKAAHFLGRQSFWVEFLCRPSFPFSFRCFIPHANETFISELRQKIGKKEMLKERERGKRREIEGRKGNNSGWKCNLLPILLLDWAHFPSVSLPSISNHF